MHKVLGIVVVVGAVAVAVAVAVVEKRITRYICRVYSRCKNKKLGYEIKMLKTYGPFTHTLRWAALGWAALRCAGLRCAELELVVTILRCAVRCCAVFSRESS